jgi:hypothetical protein
VQADNVAALRPWADLRPQLLFGAQTSVAASILTLASIWVGRPRLEGPGRVLGKLRRCCRYPLVGPASSGWALMLA